MLGSEIFRERLWPETYFREQRQAESSSHGNFVLQDSIFWSETYFREQHGKVRRMAIFVLQDSVFWPETYFRAQHMHFRGKCPA